jgi:hypothetical protein
MPKSITKKKFTCILCTEKDIGNVDSDREIICSTCLNKLINTSNEKKKNICKTLRDKGFIRKAELIEEWLHEEEVKYEEYGRNVDRERVNQQTRFTKQERKKR